jgi:molybdopterin molybdotransferase
MAGPEHEEELVPVDLVLARVLEGLAALPAEAAPLEECGGRVLAESISAPFELPRFDNAAMDGFAVRSADLAGATRADPAILTVAGASYAGAASAEALTPETCVRIATGAPIPDGADAVVRLEDSIEHGDRVSVGRPVAAGENVRHRGEDLERGEEVLLEGTTIGPGQVAAAAALGLERLPVPRRPVVSVIVTGDEVVGAGRELGEASVFDAAGPGLRAAAQGLGCTGRIRGPVADDPAELARCVREEAQRADVVLTVGGVSVGPRDHVRTALGDLVEVFRVALRPARPFATGRSGDALVCCLPGNPLAAMAAFEVFVRPALNMLLGRQPGVRRRLTARLDGPFEQAPGRMHLLRAVVRPAGDEWRVHVVGPAGAGRLAPLARSNAWLVVPADAGPLAEGAVVEVWPADDLPRAL